MEICHIFAAGQGVANYKIGANDFVIAADGGYKTALENGITPHLVLGDFDSLGFVPQIEEKIVLPKEKDDTDTLAAVKAGLKKGYKTFIIYGGLGGRTDHTIANIQTLSFIAKAGGRGYLVSENEVLTVIENSEICFKPIECGNASVFSLCEKSEAVTIKGLFYELENATLTSAMPLGVSNEFVGKQALIRVERGQLLVVFSGSLEYLLEGE